MKKIVALVLALALALSLATVAFAAGETGYFASKVDSKMKLENATLEQVKEAGEKNVAMYSVTFAVNGKQFPVAAKFILGNENDYEYVFVKGEEVTYLKKAVSGAYTGVATLVPTVAEADAVCGDIVAEDGVVLYDYNGKMMKAVEALTFENVVKNTVHDHLYEVISDMIGFTKADFEDAYKYQVANFVKSNEYKNSKTNMEALENFVKAVFTTAAGYYAPVEKYDFSANWVKDNFDVFGKLAEGLVEKFPVIADEGLSFESLGVEFATEAWGNIHAYIESYMPWAPAAKPATHESDASFNGDFSAALARAILKPALTIKAVALVDGTLVTLGDAVEGTDYEVVAHTYAADFEMVEGKLTLTKVYCEDCDKVFDFVIGCKADAEKAFGTEYEDVTNAFKTPFETKFLGVKPSVDFDWATMAFSAGWDGKDVYGWDLLDESSRCMMVALGGKQLFIGTAKAVESAETFDAGIALYAGMALMSVTGSAIVIGKKKEF